MSEREVYRHEALTIWFTRAGEDQMHIVASVAEQPPDVGRTCEEAYQRIAEALTARDMQIVHERIFGSLEAQSTVLRARQRALAAGGITGDLPLTYVQGRPVWSEAARGAPGASGRRPNGPPRWCRVRALLGAKRGQILHPAKRARPNGGRRPGVAGQGHVQTRRCHPARARRHLQ